MLLYPRLPARWKPQPWDWSWGGLAEPFSEIARTCSFLLPLWETGGDPKCVVTRTTLARQTGVASGASPYGPALTRTAGTFDHLVGPSGFRPVATADTTGYTTFGVANPAASSAAAGSGSLFMMRRTAPYTQFGLLFNFSGAGAEGVSGAATAYNQWNTAIRSSESQGAIDGRWHVFGSTFNPSSGSRLWRDAVLRSTDAGVFPAGESISDPAQIVVIGGLNASGFGIIGGISIVATWPRPLADWEMRTLHDDPMGLLRPALPRTFYIPTGSGGAQPPAVDGTSSVTLGLPSTASAGNRTLPQRTASSAVTLAKPITASSGARTIPQRNATSAATLST